MNDNMAAFAHFGARLGAFFYWTRFLLFRKQFTVRQYTTLIYLINLLGKLVFGLWLDSELHYFSIFTENKKNEHLSSANVTDVNLVLKKRTHMRLCINMLIFTHNLGNWLMSACDVTTGIQCSSLVAPVTINNKHYMRCSDGTKFDDIYTVNHKNVTFYF